MNEEQKAEYEEYLPQLAELAYGSSLTSRARNNFDPLSEERHAWWLLASLREHVTRTGGRIQMYTFGGQPTISIDYLGIVASGDNDMQAVVLCAIAYLKQKEGKP